MSRLAYMQMLTCCLHGPDNGRQLVLHPVIIVYYGYRQMSSNQFKLLLSRARYRFCQALLLCVAQRLKKGWDQMLALLVVVCASVVYIKCTVLCMVNPILLKFGFSASSLTHLRLFILN